MTAGHGFAEIMDLNKVTTFRPKKRLAQHFLKNPGLIQKIIDRSGFDALDVILEVGPGLGALTLPLAGRVRKIIAVEKDARLAEMLGEKLIGAGVDNVTLINDDILAFDFQTLAPPAKKKIQVIGNLPYNISSPLLEKLMTHRALFGRAVLMFQAELGRRLLAVPGHRAYGAITVALKYFAEVSPVLKAPKEAFYPRPKVDSLVLRLDFENPHPRRADDEGHFRRTVKGAFAHKRKTLLNSLRASLTEYGKVDILKALEICRIDPKKRAEALDIDDFLSLSTALAQNPPPDLNIIP